MKSYHQITEQERYLISHLRKQGFIPSQIARQLGRHRSTILRECKRNSDKGGRVYRPSKAQERTNGRRSRSRKKLQYTDQQLELVWKYIRKFWSPEQVSCWLKEKGLLRISHETIYRYIWRNKAQGGGVYVNLRGARKQRRKRYGAYDSRGQIAAKRHISNRPMHVEDRQEQGHWEIDTVMGSSRDTHCILTLVERKTGYTLIGKLPNRTKAALNERLEYLLEQHPKRFKTITADNGTEFHGYAEIESNNPVTYYFATPYHSWERGTNENTNGLIRQYLPKGKSMMDLRQIDCNQIAEKLNTRPRKRLNFKTPKEEYDYLPNLLHF